MPTPCSTAIPAECGRIFEEIRSIQNEIQALQAELRRASPREKPAIIRQIRELTTTKRDREAAYASCANNPRPIALRFLGAMVMASLTTPVGVNPRPASISWRTSLPNEID